MRRSAAAGPARQTRASPAGGCNPSDEAASPRRALRGILAASLLTAQAPAPIRPITLAQVERLEPNALALQLIGKGGFTHKRLCGTIPGTGCETGGDVRAIVFSTDFMPTRFPGLCAADRTIVNLARDARRPEDIVAVRSSRRSPAFRLGRPCTGSPRKNEIRGDFTVTTPDRVAVPADAWLVLRAARAARAMLARSSVPLDCENIAYLKTMLCSDASSAFAERRLAEMHETEITRGPAGQGATMRLELWSGRDQPILTHVRADLDLATLPGDASDPIVVRSVKLREYEFVD